MTTCRYGLFIVFSRLFDDINITSRMCCTLNTHYENSRYFRLIDQIPFSLGKGSSFRTIFHVYLSSMYGILVSLMAEHLQIV